MHHTMLHHMIAKPSPVNMKPTEWYTRDSSADDVKTCRCLFLVTERGFMCKYHLSGRSSPFVDTVSISFTV